MSKSQRDVTKATHIVENVQISTTSTSAFSGPLPHPEILKQYDEIVPGMAERILIMAEKEQEHQLHTDKQIVEAQINEIKFGRICGLLLILVLIILSAIFAYLNHPYLACVALSLILGIATIFVLRKKASEKK